MSDSNDENKALWLRVLKDKDAKAWIKAHADEFPERSFYPDRVNFSNKYASDRQQISEIIAAGMPYDDPALQKLAEEILTAPPHYTHLLATKDRSTMKLYAQMAQLQAVARAKWRAARAALVNARVADTPLECEPQRIALHTCILRHNEREEMVYLIRRDGDEYWVDTAGKRFPEEIQEVLHDMRSNEVPPCENLEVEIEKV